jgi:integrase
MNGNVRRIVREIGKKIGRPDFTTHALRNTVVTLSLNAKANLLDVQQVVGHSEASTTSRYDSGSFERKKAVVESLPSIEIPCLKLVV